MSLSLYPYAIETGADVALNNLLNVQQLLYAYNRVTAAEAKYQVAIVSDPPDFAPIRIPTLDSQESRDGLTYHAWDLMLTTGAVNYWLNWLWPTAVTDPTADISTLVTINTRIAQISSYSRYNCYAIFPTIRNKTNTQGDLMYSHKRGLWYLHQRFNDLVPSA